MVVTVGKHTFYMDGFLKSNLEIAKNILRDDNDLVVMCDGAEGGGKSVLTMQCAYFMDDTFNLDRIAFTPKQFMTIVKNAQKYQSVVYDEAFSGLLNRASLTFTNLAIVRMLAEVRQKNLALFIVCPTFFDLDRYAALWRSRALINVYRGNAFDRGYFRFYGYEAKKNLYVEGRQKYNYHCQKPDFYGRFTNYYTVPEATYRQIKYQAFTNRRDQVSQASRSTRKEIENYVLNRIAQSEALQQGSLTNVQQLLGMKAPTFWARLRRARENLGKTAEKESQPPDTSHPLPFLPKEGAKYT